MSIKQIIMFLEVRKVIEWDKIYNSDVVKISNAYKTQKF